jgi:hypothetical protein
VATWRILRGELVPFKALPAMPVSCKLLLLAGLLALVAFQITNTVKVRKPWPFTGHNLFSAIFPLELTQFAVVLHDSCGGRVTAVPGEVVPIEYFRLNNLFNDIYIHGSSLQREQFARDMLHWLNHSPWRWFDEMYPAIRPPAKSTFIGLQIVIERFDLRRPELASQAKHTGQTVEVLYSFFA